MPGALIDATNLAIPKFEKNQAGLILKGDGTFTIWSTFEDPINPTEQQLHQMKALMAFAAALKLPPIMDVLLQVANDPAIFSEPVNTGLKN